MKKVVMIRDVTCEECRSQMYTEVQVDGTFTLKCTDEACKNYNVPWMIPTVELIPYKPKEKDNVS